MNRLVWRPGGRQAIGSVLLAATSAGIVVAVSPLGTQIGGRVAVASVGFFALALAVGSTRLVGLTTFAMAASTLATTSSSDPAWVRSTLIGCIWYAAVELAWESIDRREHQERSAAVAKLRINEVATVVTVALVMAAVAFAISSIAPQRTLLTQGATILVVLTTITFATRALEAAATR